MWREEKGKEDGVEGTGREKYKWWKMKVEMRKKKKKKKEKWKLENIRKGNQGHAHKKIYKITTEKNEKKKIELNWVSVTERNLDSEHWKGKSEAVLNLTEMKWIVLQEKEDI